MHIREYLEKHRYTQKEFATKLGITYTHLRAVMLKNQYPSRKLAAKIEAASNGEITKEELIFG